MLIEHFRLQPVERLYEPRLKHQPIRGLYTSPDFPRLFVVDKPSCGGKADALNAGVNVARAPLICAIDADTLLEPDSLLRVVRPFIEEPQTIAVGGTIRIANGCVIEGGRVLEPTLSRNFLALVQVVEYPRAFLMARLGLSRMGALLIVSGAFGLFDRQAVLDVGGAATAPSARTWRWWSSSIACSGIVPLQAAGMGRDDADRLSPSVGRLIL